ncbi:MAG: DMT family transporter [Desulfobacterales bacterium]|nr:DMT family transporter [Desulfobacterales bacterium]
MKPDSGYLLEIHIAVFLFGLAGLFGKLILLPPVIIVLGRVFFATLFLSIILVYFRQRILLKQRSDYLKLALSGLLLAIHWITFFKSIQISTVAIGLLTFSTFPVFTALLEPIFFNEKPALKDICIALTAMAGIILITPDFNINSLHFQGILWGIASGFTFAILSILNRKYVQIYSGMVIAFYQDLFATIILTPFLFVSPTSFAIRELFLLFLLGIFCTGIAHAMFIKSLGRIRVQTASIIACLEPVYGITAALLLLNEIPSLKMITGGLIIVSITFYVSVTQNPA